MPRERHLDYAPWDTDIKEEDVWEVLNFALSKYDKARDHENHSCTLRVVQAPEQIVAGMNYCLDAEIS